MMKIIRGENSIPLTPLDNLTVVVVGYGNQGRAHTLNLRDSGVNCRVAARSGTGGFEQAVQDGFTPTTISEGAEIADLLIMALPDEIQGEVFRDECASNLRPGSVVGFLHGFSIHYQLIKPSSDLGIVLVAPKGPGHTLRLRYEQGLGIPCLFAVHQDTQTGDAEAIGLAWGRAIGCARAGIVYTSFAHETETDLFGEQTVLCGGMTWLMLAAFETLVSAGYPPEMAYLECCQEVKQVADLMYERGLEGMMNAISNTAEFGTYHVGPQLIDESLREKMQMILKDIQNGHFAETLGKDATSGFTWFRKQHDELASHPIEQAGKDVRSLFPWFEKRT